MQNEKGFSLLELIIAMTITLTVLGMIGQLLARSLSARDRENAKTEALTATNRALNLMSREIQNAGSGLTNNGILTANSNETRIRFRANLNKDEDASDAGEDITYSYDAPSRSIVRYDQNSGVSTTIASKVNALRFEYRDYVEAANGAVTISTFDATPSEVTTGKVRIIVTANLEAAFGQPSQTLPLISEVTLRNSPYVLRRY